MPGARSKKKSPRVHVQRITVDEWLEEDLLRLAVAKLKSGVTDLSEDCLEHWKDETNKLVTPSNVLRTLGLKKGSRTLSALIEALSYEGRAAAEHLELWRRLKEGQVFLAGSLSVTRRKPRAKGAPREVVHIRVAPGEFDIIRIDTLPAVKRVHQDAYTAALRSGEDDDGH